MSSDATIQAILARDSAISLLAALVVIVAASLTYDYFKKRKKPKGDARFDVPDRRYRRKEKVEGHLVITSPKAVKIDQVKLKLICYTIRKTRGRKTFELKEVLLHRTDQIVGRNVEIPAGSFRLPISVPLPEQLDPAMLKQLREQDAAKTSKAATTHRGEIELNWDLSAIVKLPGMDLACVVGLKVDWGSVDGGEPLPILLRMQ
jgi:hypothetical protein